MRQTPNLKLPIIPAADYQTTLVTDMIESIQGDVSSSAFNIIDGAVAGKQDSLEFNVVIPEQTPYVELTTLKDGDTYYLLTGTGVGGT